MSSSVRYIRAGEGETLWFAGAHRTVEHPGVWSGGGFSLVEVTVPRGRATPLHRDPSDETFYLLEGDMLFHAEGSDHAAHAGDTISITSGVPHAFTATSDTARFLVFDAPGTHDSYFRDGGGASHVTRPQRRPTTRPRTDPGIQPETRRGNPRPASIHRDVRH